MRSSEFITEVKARYEMTDLDPWTFDQTPAGWRGLPSSARQADAIQQYIETYVKDGRFVGAPKGAKTLRPYILYWHLGQVLTQMGRNGMAARVMRQALDDGEPGWNAYVMATISFLRKDRRDFDHWAPLARGNEETIKRLTAGWGLPYKQAYAGQSAVAEVSDERLQTYLNQAGQQVDRRQERMAQARERLNKGYEIYHADRPAGSSQIVDRFEANTPALAQRYYEKFITRYESDRDFDLRLRRATGIIEVITPVTPIVPPTTKRPSLARHPGMLRKDDPSPQDLETDLKVRGRDPVDINAMLRQIDAAKKLKEALHFVRPGELRGSYSDQQMLQMGFRRAKNGAWYIDQRRWDALLQRGQLREINADDELTVSQHIEDYFFKRGYQFAGEGRDQMAFVSPRNTVVKVLGIGDPEREKIVKDYVAFFLRNQRNPYYPRIYNTGEFSLNDETYFVYEMEYLDYVANEEATLEYLEDLMNAAARGYADAYQQNNPMPPELDEDEVQGLLMATEDLIDALGGHAPLDLSNIENLRRRSDGHLVIMDPFSL
jgi:hypothetical protein